MCTITKFNERLSLTQMIENRLSDYLPIEQVAIQQFGSEMITQNCSILSDFLRTSQANIDASAMIVKFAPDFILLKRTAPQKVYFLDVKHLITPVYAKSKLDKVKHISGDHSLTRSRIGEIAREALLSYKRYYPNTIILIASPYNPKLLMAQFADQIKCLYCYRDPNNGEYDCNNCPSKNGLFFDIERMGNSVGSQTPITNIDLDSFIKSDEFFANIGITVSQNASDELLTLIKNEPINIPRQLSEDKKNNVIDDLVCCGCNWLSNKTETTVFSSENNDFYHSNRDCFCLRNHQITTFDSVDAAITAGKRKCRFCEN